MYSTLLNCTLKNVVKLGDFLVVQRKTQSAVRGTGSIPRCRANIPHARWHSQKVVNFTLCVFYQNLKAKRIHPSAVLISERGRTKGHHRNQRQLRQGVTSWVTEDGQFVGQIFVKQGQPR